MIDHNLSQFGLDENNQGEALFPSEKGSYNVVLTQRQFIIQARRAFSAAALDAAIESEGLKVTHNATEEAQPFIYVKLVVKPDTDLPTFGTSDESDAFFDKVLATLGRSEVRGFRGNRAVFLSTFERADEDGKGEVLVAYALIGTSVFYSDYRVTTGYPSTEDEAVTVVGAIYEQLITNYPSFGLEMSFELLEEDTDSLWN